MRQALQESKAGRVLCSQSRPDGVLGQNIAAEALLGNARLLTDRPPPTKPWTRSSPTHLPLLPPVKLPLRNDQIVHGPLQAEHTTLLSGSQASARLPVVDRKSLGFTIFSLQASVTRVAPTRLHGSERGRGTLRGMPRDS